LADAAAGSSGSKVSMMNMRPPQQGHGCASSYAGSVQEKGIKCDVTLRCKESEPIPATRYPSRRVVMPTNSLKRAAHACGASMNGRQIGLKLLKLPVLGRELAAAGQLPFKLDNFRSRWCVNRLFGLTILLASATSFACARASETCWHPGLSRNIGIAEQSCRSSAADTHNPRDLKDDAAGQRPQRRHPKPIRNSERLPER
jgi:hypothetical protein